MNNRSRRLCRDLEALGFVRDYDALTKGIAYRHPNQPNELVKVFDAMTDSGRTSVLRKANKIADTGWAGPREPQTIKERAEVTRRKEKTQRQREDEARQARAEAAEHEYAARERLLRAERRRRDIESLMRPGRA